MMHTYKPPDVQVVIMLMWRIELCTEVSILLYHPTYIVIVTVLIIAAAARTSLLSSVHKLVLDLEGVQ